MGWFSPVKGSYPSLAQVDKTLPVKTGVTGIQRGTIVTLKADDTGASKEGVWDIAPANGQDKLLYVALQDYTDPTAGFAGDAFNPDPDAAKGEGTPRITAIDLAQDGEFETSVFDTSKTYAVGEALYAVNGILTNVNPGSGYVVGYVTLPATTRWINNAIAVPKDGTDPRLAIRTGATKAVLRFKTAV